jgi:GntR family transcriptional regulator
MFNIDIKDAAPIWRQIEEGMRRMIAIGTLSPGDPVPSVRDLARTLQVNPNTVARAYLRLTDTGIFTVRRGEGTYVADQPAQLRKSERAGTLRDASMRYARAAMSVGASIEEAVGEVTSSYERLVRESRRKA